METNSRFTKKGEFNKTTEERLQRDINPPWSLHIRSFWKMPFINPPEAKDRLLG